MNEIPKEYDIEKFAANPNTIITNNGGAYPAVRPEVVAATQAIKTGDDVIVVFSNLSRALMAKAAENERQSRTLAALLDTLLPKLMSGELRVGEAEAFIGRGGP